MNKENMNNTPKATAKGVGKLRNLNAYKKSGFMVAIIIVMVALLVMLNAVSLVVAGKVNTTIDVTRDNTYSLTDINIEFIKGIDTPVEIVVCAPRSDYMGSAMVNYALEAYYVQETDSPSNYFNQTVALLENYPKYNDNITIKYVDTQSPDFDLLEQDSELSVSYGDIIVTAQNTVDGKKVDNMSVLAFDDIYAIESTDSGYSMGGYSPQYISGSYLETELSGAIYSVTSGGAKKVAYLSGRSTEKVADFVLEKLNLYNYEVTEVEGIVTAAALKDVDIVMLAAPTKDLTAEELSVLDTFLENNGNRGKSFFVFGSPSSPSTPNIDNFMEEWGIKVENGIAFETSDSRKNGDALFLVNPGESEITKEINSYEGLYYTSGNIALTRKYETSGTRTTNILLTTSASAVVAPKGSGEGYEPPKKAERREIPVVMVTTDVKTAGAELDYAELTSYVGYFASVDFLSETSAATYGNVDMTLTVLNKASGRTDMYFYPKVVGTYVMSPSDAAKTVVEIITMYAMPIVVFLGGVFVWIRRRTR